MLEYSDVAKVEMSTLRDAGKKNTALKILEAGRIRLSAITDTNQLAQVLTDTEKAIANLYDNPRDSDRHIVEGIALSLCVAARRTLLNPNPKTN